MFKRASIFFILAMQLFSSFVLSQPNEHKVALIIDTDFKVPILRYNFYKTSVQDQTNETGQLKFLNSSGVGIGITYCDLFRTTTNGQKKETYANTVGGYIGLLFAADQEPSRKSTIFTPTIGISVLNFQIGFGYELGTKADQESRTCITINYGVAIGNLVQGATKVLKEWELDNAPSKFIF